MIQFAATVSSAIAFWTIGILFVSSAAPQTGAQFVGRLSMLGAMAATGAAMLAFLSGAVAASPIILACGVLIDLLALYAFDRIIGLRQHLVETWVLLRDAPIAAVSWWHERLQRARQAVESRK